MKLILFCLIFVVTLICFLQQLLTSWYVFQFSQSWLNSVKNSTSLHWPNIHYWRGLFLTHIVVSCVLGGSLLELKAASILWPQKCLGVLHLENRNRAWRDMWKNLKDRLDVASTIDVYIPLFWTWSHKSATHSSCGTRRKSKWL
jgi:hypothetical protein